jgi:dipeptidyl aminopeptidase/acylaminoacyl peptidase
MRLRAVVTALTAGVAGLAIVGLRPTGGSAEVASSAKSLPHVRGSIAYICRVRYLDGYYPEICLIEGNNPPGPDSITYDKGPKRDPAWSPEGERLAYVRGTPGSGQIYTLNYWGTSCPEEEDYCMTLGKTGRVAGGEEPAWSPTGTKIAFVSRRNGNADIYVVGASGGAERRLTTSPEDDTAPAWSPNGKAIAFTRGSSVRLINADGSHDRLFGAGTRPAWSPNGKQLAFEFNGDIWLANSSGGGGRSLTSTPEIEEKSPTWASDGGAVAFAAQSGGVDAVYVRHFGGPLQRIVLNGDFERAFVQTSIDWQRVRVLVATVSDRKPYVSFRDAHGRRIKTIRAGAWALAYVDKSRRHGITFSWGPLSDSSVAFVGRRWPNPVSWRSLTLMRPGVYRYWCPAHRRERGTYRIVSRP